MDKIRRPWKIVRGTLENSGQNNCTILEVEDADLARVDDRANRVERGAVVLPVELPVLHEPLVTHVLLELGARHEVVVLSVDLAVALRSGRV